MSDPEYEAPQTSACPTTEDLERHAAWPDSAIETHVETCAACRVQLATVAENLGLFEELVQSRRRTETASPPDRVPVVSGYAIQSEIQRGGQGVVWRAEQLGTHRSVALKVLYGGALATSARRRRFEREAELAASLDHPGVVRVFDSGVTPDGLPFLALELVDGVPLDEVWSTPPQRAAERTRLLRTFVAIAEAVHFAHQHGVLHRDLKPQNILVDAQARPHVVDFGVARALEAGEDDPSWHTGTGAFLGTLAYASPEQVAGDPHAVDVRSDVYSLGVVLYERLVGRFPYPVGGGPGDLTRSILDAEPEPPTLLDRDLATILLTALAKEPERRYQTAGDLQRDLERFLAHEPILARADNTLYILRKLLRRHRVSAVALGLVLAATLTAGLVSFVFWRQTVLAAEQVVEENDRARRSLNLLERMLVAPDHRVEADGPMTLSEALGWASARVEAEFSEFPATELEVHELLADAYLQLGEAERADRHRRRVLVLRRELYGEESAETAKAMHRIARYYQKEVEALRHGFPGGRDFDHSERPLRLDPGTAPAALTATQRTQLEEGLELELGAQAILLRVEPDKRGGGLSNRRVHALILRELGRPEQAERELRTLLDETHTTDPDSPLEQHARVLGELCVLLAEAGRLGEAEASLRVLIARREETLGARAPEVMLARHNLAAVLLGSGRVREAEVLLAEVRTAAREVLEVTDWRRSFYLDNEVVSPR